MELTTPQESMEVRFQGEQVSLPLTILSTLPRVTLLSIEQPLFKDSGELQIKAADYICTLLDVKFQDKAAQIDAVGIWANNAQSYKLTPNEVVEAYKMAVNQRISLPNGDPIRVFPNLSIITQSEILNSYDRFKKLDTEYQKGRKMLLKLKETPKSDELKQLDRVEFYKSEYRYFLENDEILTPDPFFERISKEMTHVKLNFVIKTLNTYRPRAKTDKKLGKYTEYTPSLHFTKYFVESIIKGLKIHEKTIEEWVEFWTKEPSKSK